MIADGIVLVTGGSRGIGAATKPADADFAAPQDSLMVEQP
jgi:hypothetical protein